MIAAGGRDIHARTPWFPAGDEPAPTPSRNKRLTGSSWRSKLLAGGVRDRHIVHSDSVDRFEDGTSTIPRVGDTQVLRRLATGTRSQACQCSWSHSSYGT